VIPSTADAPGTPAVRVEVYRTRYCGYCTMAVRLLDQQRVPFTEIDVSGDQDRRRWLTQVTGRRTVPQIFIDGRSIGGYDELASLARRGELQRLLAANGP
jgi:glutaredoxin 3